MSARPRPVTATVTKPPWMQVPGADAAMYRRQSLTSNGSTASLTSVLDHDSYISEPEVDEKTEYDTDERFPDDKGDTGVNAKKSEVRFYDEPKQIKIRRHIVESSSNLRRSNSSDSGLSAWETWLVEKAKEERRQRQQRVQQRKQDKLDKLAKEREKQMKEFKAQEVRHEWLQKKAAEEKLKEKMRKLKINNERKVKEEQEERIRSKADSRYAEWKDKKQQEEKEHRLKEKERRLKEQEEKKAREEQAQHKYQEWLKAHKRRPQSAPPKQPVTGYNNNAAYPRPGYVNPIPWQHPAVPKVKTEKPKKAKPRKYVWNPDKYF